MTKSFKYVIEKLLEVIFMTMRPAGDPPGLEDNEAPRPSSLRRLLPYGIGAAAIGLVTAGVLYFGGIGGNGNSGSSYRGPSYVNENSEWYNPKDDVPFAPQTLVVESYSPDEFVGLIDGKRKGGMATFVAYTVNNDDPRCTGLVDNNTDLDIGNRDGDREKFFQSCEDRRLLVVVPDLTLYEQQMIEKNLKRYNPFQILRQSNDGKTVYDRSIPYAIPVGNVGRSGKDLSVVISEIDGQTYLVADKDLLNFLKSDIVDQFPEFPVR